MPVTEIPPAPAPRPHLPEPGVALGLLCESLAHRAELAAIELEEAQEHATRCLILTGAAGALTLFAGFALTLLIASQVWDDPHRAWWLGGLTAVYVGGAIAVALVLHRRLRDWRPLDETQRQLREDYRCLTNHLNSAGR